MKRILIALALISLAGPSARADVLTDFGATNFTPDPDITTFAFTQDASTLTVTGDDTLQLDGYFTTTLDFSGVTADTSLFLVASAQGLPPASLFTVTLFNSDFSETRVYQGAFNDYANAFTLVRLTFLSETSAFTDVAGFELQGDGVGEPVTFTFASLSGASAIPEPAAFAALVGAGMLGFTALRRRRP